MRRCIPLIALLCCAQVATIACLAESGRAADPPASAPPSWYQKKKTEKVKQEREKREEEIKNQELPEVGAPVTPGQPLPAAVQLSAPDVLTDKNRLSDNLLFQRPGLTGSAVFAFGLLSQNELSGPDVNISYALGWWWKPNLVLSGIGRASAILASSYYFVLFTLGPQIRYFPSKDWAFGGDIGFGVSFGLSRVQASHLPTPPEATTLAARRGFTASAHATRLFWTKRDFGIGPILNLRVGAQSERSLFEIVAGVTFQDGRPNYTGDVTSKW